MCVRCGLVHWAGPAPQDSPCIIGPAAAVSSTLKPHFHWGKPIPVRMTGELAMLKRTVCAACLPAPWGDDPLSLWAEARRCTLVTYELGRHGTGAKMSLRVFGSRESSKGEELDGTVIPILNKWLGALKASLKGTAL